MKKWMVLLMSTIMILNTAGCSMTGKQQENRDLSQKEISRVSLYGELDPSSVRFPDYDKIAEQIDQVLYEPSGEGDIALQWQDQTYDTFGISSYVGDYRNGNDGAEEAVVTMASVLSATLLGIDKSNQNGTNYVSQLGCYYLPEERIVTNNPGGKSADYSMWYILYPSILFTEISMQYPDEEEIRQDCLNMIEQWYQAGQKMQKENNFNYTGFDFSVMEPYSNDIWAEPDSATGIAVLMYFGYEMTGKTEYLELCKACLSYNDSFYGSSYYEILLCYAPYMAAKLNAEYDTDYSMDNLFGDIFDGNSIPRGGWGQLTGTWGEISVDGLMGSVTDRGGYAFAMNTFATAYILSPVAKYDTRYAQALGEWYLNVAEHSQYFFYNYVDSDLTSAGANAISIATAESELNVIPFEGIRKSNQSKTPWIGGDAVECDWAMTDFSVYSGAHVGMLASIIEETDVKGILRVDCTKADMGSEQWQTYLIYNPYGTDQEITYVTGVTEAVDLYDAVSGGYIAEDVSGEVRLSIPAGRARVISQLPQGTVPERQGNTLMADGRFVDADQLTVQVTNLKRNDTVHGKFEIVLSCFLKNTEDRVSKVCVMINDREYSFDGTEKIVIDADEAGSGSKTLQITVQTEEGLTDCIDLRLKLE